MARVMDEATIVGTPEGTCVRLVKRLTGDASGLAGAGSSEDQL